MRLSRHEPRLESESYRNPWKRIGFSISSPSSRSLGSLARLASKVSHEHQPIVYFLNGPNANLYGLDRNGTYGRDSFGAIKERCERHAASLGLALEFRQSNHEGVLVDWIQEARQKAAVSSSTPPASLTLHPDSRCAACFRRPHHRAHMSNIWKRSRSGTIPMSRARPPA